MILRQTMKAVQVSEARHEIAFPCDLSYAYLLLLLLLLQDHWYSPLLDLYLLFSNGVAQCVMRRKLDC